MIDLEKKRLATRFIDGLRARDAAMLRSIMTEDVVWSLPGSSTVSGEARGVAGIVSRAEKFAARSLTIEILHVVYGRAGMALLLHNTGTHGAARLDEHLTTVIQLEGERIKRLDTYISDVEMLDRYFGVS
jgi:ketosteroid isomerase-like protein